MSLIQPVRIASIDILRALTMLLMIFVNDLWSLQNVPAWLEHTKAREDGMGLADVIFPAFLVIVGMSVPFSIASRHAKNQSTSSIFLHIILRALALLVMGLFLVNGENISESGSGMPRSLWNSLCCLAFIFIWNAYPRATPKFLLHTLKIIGWGILIILAWLYRGGSDADLRFGTLWWGILGLIGWAYLVSAIVYATARGNLLIVGVFWLLSMSLSIATHAGWVSGDSLLATLTSPLANGAMPAFVTGGMLTTMIFIRLQKQESFIRLAGILLLVSGLLVAAGFITREFFIISKILATPPWVLICTGITVAFFVLIYWIADYKKNSKWFDPIKPGGTNTLLCYLLPYLAYATIYGFMRTDYPDAISNGIAGLLKSLLFAFVIIWIGGILGKAGVRLKL